MKKIKFSINKLLFNAIKLFILRTIQSHTKTKKNQIALKELEIKNIKIEELRPYENNPRNNEAAVDKVAASISEFGFKVPIIIDRENACNYRRKSAATLPR